MELSKVLEKLTSYKPGTFIKISWERDVSSAKARKMGYSICKRAEGIFRLGLNYENLGAVRELHNHNSDNSTDYSSWFKHSSMHKAIIENKNDESKKYLQVFTVANNRVKTQMYINGGVKDPYSLYEEGMITKAALPSTESHLVFNLNIENISCFGSDC